MTLAAFPFHAEADWAMFERLPGAKGLTAAARAGMGRVWADAPRHPRAAVMTVGDFLYAAGQPGPSAARLLRAALGLAKRPWVVYTPDAWRDALLQVAPDASPATRYAFDPDAQPEDERLRALLRRAPEHARFLPIEGERIAPCRREAWSRDFVSLFTDEGYARDGLGVLVEADGIVVSGASSYVAYPGGLEVQAQTRDGFENRGFATLAAAKLLLTAHERGLRAGWDAANPASAHIAEKLGYRPIGAYPVFLVDRT